MTERPDKITAEYIPSPPSPPDKIVVKAPNDNRGYPLFPDLHLSVDQAWELRDSVDFILDLLDHGVDPVTFGGD